MKKISKKQRAHFCRVALSRRKREQLQASLRHLRQARGRVGSRPGAEPDPELTKILGLEHARRKLRKEFYRKRWYKDPALEVIVSGEFGLESDFEKYLELASEFIGSKARRIGFSLQDCSKVWPSAITLFCSFKQWTEITGAPAASPDIWSSESRHASVNTYLAHSGFYDYVNRPYTTSVVATPHEGEIVPIQREVDLAALTGRENAIQDVIEHHSALSQDEVEKFADVVLSEIFSNVTEHGKSYRDKGYWMITQHHPRAGIISLCVADNGIGIKRSLQTGPQGPALRAEIHSNADGEYIKRALDANVSGAVSGSIKEKGLLRARFPQGRRRGNGLKRVVDTCRECGVSFNLLSQKGFLGIDKSGRIRHNGTHSRRIFAGTLYHFSIPAKQQAQEDGHEHGKRR